MTNKDHNITQMRANFAIENMKPDTTDIFLQDAYKKGNLKLSDLLAYAINFANQHAAN